MPGVASEAARDASAIHEIVLQGKVVNLESDTFGNPIFQKGLQN